MHNYNYKIENSIKSYINNFKNPKILEFGVKEGRSTKIFLQLCKSNNGKLFSVDIDDCSKVSNDPNWKFIKSRDDNFDYVKSEAPYEFDVLFIDTIHEANHVKKILYNYYDIIKVGGYIFIDDISHLPYLKKFERDNFYCEINNQETFKILTEIYNLNLKI